MIANKKIGGAVAAGSAIMFALFVWSQPAMAQDSGGLLQVAEVKIKSSHVGDFVDLQRQMAEAGRAAGRTGRNRWQVMHGRTNTFHIVEPRANFAAYDAANDPPMTAAEWARWVGRIQESIETRTVFTLREYPVLAIPVAEDAEENLIRLRIRTVKPGMNDEYASWVRDDLLPELREGGASGVNWYKVDTGGSGNTWFSITRHPNYADMDPPGPLGHMSERQIESLLGKSASMQTGNNEDLVVRYRADLSY